MLVCATSDRKDRRRAQRDLPFTRNTLIPGIDATFAAGHSRPMRSAPIRHYVGNAFKADLTSKGGTANARAHQRVWLLSR
jgi:hypothetical protein